MKTLVSTALLALAALPAGAQQPGLDPAFGSSGTATTVVDATDPPRATAAVVIRHGLRYYHVGSSATGLAIVRQHARGGLDTTWGRDGIVELSSPAARLVATSAALEPDGELLVAGYAQSGDDGAMRPLLCRFMTYGSPDPSLRGRAGDVAGCTTDFASLDAGAARPNEVAQAVTVQADGGILVATHAVATDGGRVALDRFLPDGSPDLQFGPAVDPLLNHGVSALGSTASLRFDPAWPIAGLALDAQGRIVLGGSVRHGSAPGGDADFFVAVFDRNGALDPAFGDLATAGLAVVDANVAAPGSADLAMALALDESGAILLAGTSTDDADGMSAVVARLTPAGQRDAAFGDGGAVVAGCAGATWTDVADIAIDATGRLILGGPVLSEEEVQQVCVVRLHADGRTDATFADGGSLRFSFAPDDPLSADRVSSLALTPYGQVMVGGYVVADDPGTDTLTDNAAFRLARLNWY